jgi:hypothetical protein
MVVLASNSPCVDCPLTITVDGQGVARPYETRRGFTLKKCFTLHCIALHWVSIIKQRAIHGQDAARPYRTRLANLSLCQPHRQIEYQRGTPPPVPRCTVGPYGLPNTPFYQIAGPPAPAFLICQNQYNII